MKKSGNFLELVPDFSWKLYFSVVLLEILGVSGTIFQILSSELILT